MLNLHSSINWDDVEVQRGGYIYHGHRINIENMPEAERDSLLKELNDNEITYAVRNASADSGRIHAGDLTVRVIEPESVKKLREQYFRWGKQENGVEYPITETISEYNQRHQKAKETQQNKGLSIDRETAAKLVDFFLTMAENGDFKTVPQNVGSDEKNTIRNENVALAMKVLASNRELGITLTGEPDSWTKAHTNLQHAAGTKKLDLRKVLEKVTQLDNQLQSREKTSKEY